MTALPTAEWLNALLGLLQSVQLALLRVLHALGLAGESHGQAAWPWPQRLSGENLLIDLGQARGLAISLLLVVLALALLVVALWWRRRRWMAGGLAGLAVALVLFAPWPDTRVLLVPATPASFHASPTGFSAAAIVQGGVVYARYCVACHGADGQGQGPQAAVQPVWPPNLSGPLLWRRADGDLLWHVLHGMRDRKGVQTMAGFAGQLSDADAWAVIDYMKALGAGQALRAAGLWPQPVAVPDLPVRCDGGPARPLSSWRGQRLRLVADGAGAVVQEDPRLVTVSLAFTGAALPAGGCVAASPDAWTALALVAGVAPGELAGTQLLADRDGWLRARGQPGKADWSEDDLVCRTEGTSGNSKATPPADGLSALIASMDAEPVRYVKGGFVH
ncbi:MAG TPA: cytochrome c [Burkholderiaceae bacterium]